MENYYIERKPDSDILIIAFTGHANKLLIDSFEFFSVTNALDCNRILIKDPSKRLCLTGINKEIKSLDRLVHKLQSDIEAIKPRIVTIVGTSGGGYTAILFGHLLKADFVHAFGPTTHISPVGLLKDLQLKEIKKKYKMIVGLYIALIAFGLRYGPKKWKLLDLKKVLSSYNGVTQYSIYVCEGHKQDVLAANHLKDCKNMQIFKQPCDGHNVVRCMVKNQKLFNVLTNTTNEVVKS